MEHGGLEDAVEGDGRRKASPALYMFELRDANMYYLRNLSIRLSFIIYPPWVSFEGLFIREKKKAIVLSSISGCNIST